MKNKNKYQNRFRTITSSYYRGAHGVIIVYDITDQLSFNNLKNWIQEIEQYASENFSKMIVGNKCDLTSRRVVETEPARVFAASRGAAFMETSAKNSTNVEQAFMWMVSDISNRLSGSSSNAAVNLATKPKKSKCNV